MTEEAKTEAAKPEAPKAEAPKPVAPKAEAAKPVVEKQTNCLACNKPIIKLKHYYRDGKFYCSKQCCAHCCHHDSENERSLGDVLSVHSPEAQNGLSA